MIRFILCVTYVVVFLILSIPLLIAEWIIGKFSPSAKDISSLRIIQAVFKGVLWISGVKVTVIGEENVPKDAPVLYIGNHRSFFDIPLTYPRCPIRTGYVAKKELEKVKSGISICIFPEGTRNKNEKETDLLPFHEGSFKIATRAKCPIIPMAISGSVNLWEAHFPKIKPCHVVIEYGKPIYVDQLDKETQKHIGAYTQNILLEMLKKNEYLI